jgi:hypothetical protein
MSLHGRLATRLTEESLLDLMLSQCAQCDCFADIHVHAKDFDPIFQVSFRLNTSQPSI